MLVHSACLQHARPTARAHTVSAYGHRVVVGGWGKKCKSFAIGGRGCLRGRPARWSLPPRKHCGNALAVSGSPGSSCS